jgi:hypothetical protein
MEDKPMSTEEDPTKMDEYERQLYLMGYTLEERRELRELEIPVEVCRIAKSMSMPTPIDMQRLADQISNEIMHRAIQHHQKMQRWQWPTGRLKGHEWRSGSYYRQRRHRTRQRGKRRS